MTRGIDRLASLSVRADGGLRKIEAMPGLELVDADRAVMPEVTEWLLDLQASDRSPHTLRAYTLSLLRFLRFLWAIGCEWQQASDVEVRDFVLWARQAPKLQGNKRPASPRLPVNRVTGKPVLGERYTAATINHTLSATHEFYSFARSRGVGPAINPVPEAAPAQRPTPDGDFVYGHRGRYRQKQTPRLPRAIPDRRFDDLFRRLGNNRDRAMVAFYVSSGARASELIGLTGEMVNYGDQLIGVIRKGGALQWLPAAPDAFVWLRLYQLERGTPTAGQPVWLTLREPSRPVSYDALRAVMARVNRSLGSNWTLHDLRHTFALRALNGGVALHELQVLLGHQSLLTTSIYTRPRSEDVIAHYRAVMQKAEPDAEDTGTPLYRPQELDIVFGKDPT